MRTRTERLTTAIQQSWSLDTSSTPDEWTPDDTARGQCVPTSLVVQDYLGGELERLATNYHDMRETHYRNVVGNQIIDLSRSQYPADQLFEPAPVEGDVREYVYANTNTRARYLQLTHSVQKLMYLQSMSDHPEDSDKLVVLFDMDGNLFDFDARVETELIRAGIPIPVRSDFYMTKRLTDPAHIELVHTLQQSRGFFASLQPIPGAIEAWRFVESLGFHPRICSAPITRNPWSIREKLAAVEQHLGPRAADEAYIGKNKSECSGIVLLDDRPEIADARTADWLHAHYTQEYNRHIDTEYRIHDWTDLDHLAKLLSRAAERYQSLHA
jgi:5'-nucleotidase